MATPDTAPDTDNGFAIAGRDVAYAEIIPSDDIEPHDLEEFCPCSPTVYYDNGLRVIQHNAFDGRDAADC